MFFALRASKGPCVEVGEKRTGSNLHLLRERREKGVLRRVLRGARNRGEWPDAGAGIEPVREKLAPANRPGNKRAPGSWPAAAGAVRGLVEVILYEVLTVD
ncbi:hypothetical protein GCM10010253_21050 [Streptomyces badius]|uniref:Transposase n=1 Tax=Streptomyces badius TaxID=1941 RepID=A0ABQ2T006_STRBA|nr:hypothetical protein GCM10010253_21050 [Streptomyces badius]